MADVVYPILNAKSWWLLQKSFKRSIPASVSKSYISTVCGVQDKAARNIIRALKALGLVNEDTNTTPLANRWRVDQEYGAVCKEIIDAVYPEELIHAAPDPVDDLSPARTWFMQETGVGEAAAGYMAALYRLLVRADVEEGTVITVSAKGKKATKKTTTKAKPIKEPNKVEPVDIEMKGPKQEKVIRPDIHVDIQVHISPDSTPDQIDQIFASMAKHLYSKSSS